MKSTPKTYELKRQRGPSKPYVFPGLSDFDKGYIAGLLDGEGCIHTRTDTKKGGHFPWTRGRIVISNTDRDVLQYVMDTLKIGTIVESSNSLKRGNKLCFQWTVQNIPGAFGVACEFIGVLRIKKQAAERLIRALTSRVKMTKLRIAHVG